VSLRAKTIRVVLKGGAEHLVPLGRKAAAALDRYLRIRARHRHSDSPWLWPGIGGRDPSHFGAAGIQDMLERRSRKAGIGQITPHFFRRTFAHDWLEGGGARPAATRRPALSVIPPQANPGGDMGHLTRTAKRAAVKGRASMAVPFFKLIAVVLVVGWPLAIGNHGHTSVLGWIIRAVWWVVLAVVAVAYQLRKPKRPARARRR
jgi:hypothetical protein